MANKPSIQSKREVNLPPDSTSPQASSLSEEALLAQIGGVEGLEADEEAA